VVKPVLVGLWLGALLAGILSSIAASPVLAGPESELGRSSGSIVHVVKPGDALHAIARHHHLSPWSPVQANRLVNPDRIFPYQLVSVPSDRPRIRIDSPWGGGKCRQSHHGHRREWGNLGVYGPFSASVSFTAGEEQEGVLEARWDSPEDGSELDTVSIPVHLSQDESTVFRSHTVRRGDNLHRIALRFGTTVEAITAANGIHNPRLVRVGQVLRIP
jgi:LysM repeat protein